LFLKSEKNVKYVFSDIASDLLTLYLF